MMDLNDARVQLWALINDPNKLEEFNNLWRVVTDGRAYAND